MIRDGRFVLVRIYDQTGRLLLDVEDASFASIPADHSNLDILQVPGGAIAKHDSDTDAHNYRVSIFSVCLAIRSRA